MKCIFNGQTSLITDKETNVDVYLFLTASRQINHYLAINRRKNKINVINFNERKQVYFHKN